MSFIKFELNLETFIDELNQKLEINNNKITELLNIEKKTYANFVKPFEMMDEYLEHFFTPISHINAVNNSEQSQEVYASALPLITEYSTIISQNLDIYKAMKEILKNDTLNDEQKKVLEENVLHFELSGAHLDEEKKKRLQEIHLRKSTLSNDFSQNLLDATNAYEKVITNEKDVEGIPSSDLDPARYKEDGKTIYKFSLQMPSYIAYMTYGPTQSIREELYKAYTTRAPENALIIDEILKLKQEMSQLLGYETYSDYSLATKMAPNRDTVFNFIDELSENSFKQAQVELDELRAIAPSELKSFDSAYYSEILKKEKYDIDEEEYRIYFEQNSVVSGMFNFLEKLFGISVKKVDETLWDEKAFSYDVYVAGEQRARLYFDLEARKSKRGGAWMHNFQSHCIDEQGEEQLASAFVVCNFAPSTQTNPSLLRHDDVVTLFHEMGHALHHVLSTVNENSISGVNGVEWDAVEFPSQFLENFAYEKEVLKLFALHHETKEVIPEEMIDKLIRAKNFQGALQMLRQLEFASFDFRLHDGAFEGEEAVQKLLDAVRQKTSLIKPPEYNKFQNGFAHIFAGGYAAGYYSYKWAEVLSADAFFAIKDQGIFDTQLGRDYLNIILAKGGSQSMDILFKDLMGRAPQTNSLLRLSGIAS